MDTQSHAPRRATLKLPHDVYIRLHKFCEEKCLYPSAVAVVAIEAAMTDPTFLDRVDTYRNGGSE